MVNLLRRNWGTDVQVTKLTCIYKRLQRLLAFTSKKIWIAKVEKGFAEVVKKKWFTKMVKNIIWFTKEGKKYFTDGGEENWKKIVMPPTS